MCAGYKRIRKLLGGFAEQYFDAQCDHGCSQYTVYPMGKAFKRLIELGL